MYTVHRAALAIHKVKDFRIVNQNIAMDFADNELMKEIWAQAESMCKWLEAPA